MELQIKTATNFNTLQHVNVIANHSFTEQFSLDSLTIKQHKKSLE